jgi:hypothetical protein
LSTALRPIEATLDAPAVEVPAAGAGSRAPRLPRLRSGAAPASAVASAAARARRSRWWVELLTIVWLCWVYDAVTNLAPLRLGAALAHGRDILSTERSLGVAPEHALDRWLASHHTLGTILSYYYDNAHFAVTLGLLG